MKLEIRATIILFMMWTGASASAAPKADVVAEYKRGLGTATGGIDSVEKAAKRLLSIAKGQSDRDRDCLLHAFREYYEDSLIKYNETCGTENWDYPIGQSKRKRINTTIAKVGWVIDETEGSYFVRESGDWFTATFREIMPQAWKDFYRLRSNELKERFTEDAALTISWRRLAQRIGEWDLFVKRYPRFPEHAEIEFYLSIYIRIFLNGLDNSSFSNHTGTLSDEVKWAYEYFLKQYPGSRYHKLVKGYYKYLKDRQFCVKGTTEYLKSKGYSTMRGAQPPLY